MSGLSENQLLGFSVIPIPIPQYGWGAFATNRLGNLRKSRRHKRDIHHGSSSRAGLMPYLNEHTVFFAPKAGFTWGSLRHRYVVCSHNKKVKRQPQSCGTTVFSPRKVTARILIKSSISTHRVSSASIWCMTFRICSGSSACLFGRVKILLVRVRVRARAVLGLKSGKEWVNWLFRARTVCARRQRVGLSTDSSSQLLRSNPGILCASVWYACVVSIHMCVRCMLLD